MDEKVKMRQQLDRDKALAQVTGQPIATATKARRPRTEKQEYGCGLTDSSTVRVIDEMIRNKFGDEALKYVRDLHMKKSEKLKLVTDWCAQGYEEKTEEIKSWLRENAGAPTATATATALEQKQPKRVAIPVLADTHKHFTRSKGVAVFDEDDDALDDSGEAETKESISNKEFEE